MEKLIDFDVMGKRLYGMLHLPEGSVPAPGVVFCHGFTGNRIEAHRLFVKAARWLARRGIAAMRFDFRGSGESEGDFEEMTVSGEIEDALSAISFMRSLPEVDGRRIGMIGLSLGGCVTACAASRDGNITSIALWSAVSRPWELFRTAWGDSIPQMEEKGWVDIGGLKLGKDFIEDLKRIDPLSEIEGYKGSVLIIHGSEDLAVPLANAQDYYEKVRGERRLYIVQGADHVFSRVDWEEEVIKLTADWFVERIGVLR